VSRARTVTLAVLALALAGPARAQTSVYGVLGVGMPGRPIGVRARALGGGIAATDLASALNPSAVAGFRQLAAIATTATTYRSFEADGVSADGLRDTRFPLAVVGGPIPGQRVGFAVSFSTYADRTFDLSTLDTIDLRGASVAVEDRIGSVGAVADVRAAVAWEPTDEIRVGLGGHLISGSTRETIARFFDHEAYATLAQRRDADYTAAGVSVGVTLTPLQQLRFGASVRTDTRLHATNSLIPTTDVDLPWTLSAGWVFAPGSAVRWSGTVVWQTWSSANDDLQPVGGARAFDVVSLASGVELGGNLGGGLGLPLRVGIRYATLPFSPVDEQPHELNLAGGTALGLAGGRAVIDLAVERVMRDGGGARERAWALAVSLTVRP
jgi:hypothetical protein